MNPIFWILVVLALVALWFLLNFTFRKIAASLTPELIEKIKYEQWNGQMPSTMAGTDSSILITP